MTTPDGRPAPRLLGRAGGRPAAIAGGSRRFRRRERQPKRQTCRDRWHAGDHRRHRWRPDADVDRKRVSQPPRRWSSSWRWARRKDSRRPSARSTRSSRNLPYPRRSTATNMEKTVTESATLTEPVTRTLDAPGAVITYDVRSNDASTAPVLMLIGSPMGASGFADPGEPLHRSNGRHLRPARRRAQHQGRSHLGVDAGAARRRHLARHLCDRGRACRPVREQRRRSERLALVAKHPEQVRLLVAHEPPTAAVLPDRRGR